MNYHRERFRKLTFPALALRQSEVVSVLHMTDNTALFHLFFQVSSFSLQGSWRNQDIAFFSHCYLAFAASSVRLVLSCCCVSFKIIDAIYVTNVDVIFFLNSSSIDMKELS